jgi:hypothetical protein
MMDYRYRLSESLRNLAATAEVQLQHIEDVSREARVRISVDDLALEYDEILRFVVGNLPDIELSAETVKLLVSLDEFLDQMSGIEKETLWTLDAVVNSNEWVEVRRRACACIGALKAAGKYLEL